MLMRKKLIGIFLFCFLSGFTFSQAWLPSEFPEMQKIDQWLGSISDITEFKGNIYVTGYFKTAPTEIKQGLMKLENGEWNLVYSFFNSQSTFGVNCKLLVYDSLLVMTY